jgi:hypothetical protein
MLGCVCFQTPGYVASYVRFAGGGVALRHWT